MNAEELQAIIAAIPSPEPMRKQTRRSPTCEVILLASLEKGHSVKNACQLATISRTSLCNWRKADKRFDRLVELAIEAGRLVLSSRSLRNLIPTK